MSRPLFPRTRLFKSFVGTVTIISAAATGSGESEPAVTEPASEEFSVAEPSSAATGSFTSIFRSRITGTDSLSTFTYTVSRMTVPADPASTEEAGEVSGADASDFPAGAAGRRERKRLAATATAIAATSHQPHFRRCEPIGRDYFTLITAEAMELSFTSTESAREARMQGTLTPTRKPA